MQAEQLAPWNKAAQVEALKHGWGVYEVWDGTRLYSAIQRPLEGETFKTDEIAQQHVMGRARLGDELALRALRHAYQSNTPNQGQNHAARRKK